MLDNYNKFLKETRRGIRYNEKKLETALEVNKKLAEKERRKDLLKTKQDFDINKFNYRMENYQEKILKNRAQREERKLTETKSLIKTEYRNDISKELTKMNPNFNKKIDQILLDEFEKGKKYREIEKIKKSKSSQQISKPLKPFTIDDQLRANKFYQKELEWKKEVDTNIFYKKVQNQ